MLAKKKLLVIYIYTIYLKEFLRTTRAKYFKIKPDYNVSFRDLDTRTHNHSRCEDTP